MKKFTTTFAFALILALGASTIAGASMLWQRVTQIPDSETIRLYTQNDTLYASTKGILYRFSRPENKWDTLAPIDTSFDDIIGTMIKIGNRVFAGTYHHGVYESDDNGLSWTPRNVGLSGLGSNFIIDFTNRGDSLFVGTDGTGIFLMNLNGPPTWSNYDTGMPENIAGSIMSLFNFEGYLLSGAGFNTALYRNTPGSSTWDEIQFAPFDPRGVGMMDMAGRDGLVYGAAGNGFYISRDSGITWERTIVTNRLIASTAVVAGQDRVFGSIFYNVYGSYYFASTGNGWELIDSVAVALTYDLAILGSRLYAARYDGLWYTELNPTDVDGANPPIPSQFALAQNYPNPFNPTTTIEYSVPSRTGVTIEIFNLLGQRVRTLVNATRSAGSYRIEWNGIDDADRPVSTGVYLYRFRAGDIVATKKMLLLK